MPEYGVGHTQITLGVFEVYRVDFMWHGRRTHLTGLDTLLEVVHGDVLPYVTVEVDEYGIDAPKGIEHCRQIVIIGYLGGEFLTLYAETPTQEPCGEIRPVNGGIGRMMSVEITGCTAKLTADRHLCKRIHLSTQTIGKHIQFLSQTRGRRRLTVSLGKHGHIVPFGSQRFEFLHQFGKRRHIYLVYSFAHRHRHRCIVDVLRRQTEMYEFLISTEPHGVKPLLKEVFHSLHIMVGDRFYLFNM